MADGLLTAKSGRCRTPLPRCSEHRKQTRASAVWLTLDLLADTTVVGREHGKRIIRNSAGCEKLQFKSATYPKILQKIGRYHLVTFLFVAPLELVIMQLLRGKKIYIYIHRPPPFLFLSAFPRFPPLPFLLLPPHLDSTSTSLDSLKTVCSDL